MVVYVIPAAVVVIAFLLIFAGGAWVVGNFLIGMIPILNLLFLPLEIGTAKLAFAMSTDYEGGTKLFRCSGDLYVVLWALLSQFNHGFRAYWVQTGMMFILLRVKYWEQTAKRFRSISTIHIGL